MLHAKLCKREPDFWEPEGLSWQGAQHQVTQRSLALSTPLFDRLVLSWSVPDPIIREQFAQSPYPFMWQISDNSQCDTLDPPLLRRCQTQHRELPRWDFHSGVVTDIHSITVSPGRMHVEISFCLSLRRRGAILEKFVCFPLKETVKLKVIKIAFKEVINANGAWVVIPV